MASAPDLRAEKKRLRAHVLAQRDALGADRRREASRIILQRLLADPRYRDAQVVAAYASFGSEVDTSGLLADVLAGGRRLVLPRIDKSHARLELRRVDDLGADLVAGVWGIREPAPHCPVADLGDVEFMLVPGVAFTRDGDRLGYGGGYYDRLMAGLRPQVPRIAAAFSVQVVERLPMGERDRRVSAVVTES
ncbi:MAG TPA: 5-formyltetrahydrofolate cyclo-ligase [Burkholderiales bacterium]|jgi:5-formyltetrahydrofolate cyclo-ligase|nr:5-formyltetrahydrofolate cyclo-ligase [Burkholderiales bacterium]